jgi:hypothetical protein
LSTKKDASAAVNVAVDNSSITCTNEMVRKVFEVSYFSSMRRNRLPTHMVSFLPLFFSFTYSFWMILGDKN